MSAVCQLFMLPPMLREPHAPLADPTAARREIFRPWAWLRWSVVVAWVFWVLVFFLLVGLEGAPGRALASAGFFIVFFTALGVFYNNTRIELSADALVIRSVTSSQRVLLADVQGVEVTSNLLQTTYQVLARRPVAFSNAFSGHRRLRQLIEERARQARLDRL